MPDNTVSGEPGARTSSDHVAAREIVHLACDRFEADPAFQRACTTSVHVMRHMFPDFDEDVVTQTILVATYVGQVMGR
jgi:hypothetical protein